jgi:hypothetical protein
MKLDEAKKQVDRVLASLFYEHMKGIRNENQDAKQTYKETVEETSQLLLHMRDRLDILFGQDTEALSQFLAASGVGGPNVG